MLLNYGGTEFKMDLKQTIIELSNCFSVSGDEKNVANLCKNYLNQFTSNVEIDKFNNVIAKINEYNPDRKTILVDAHLDEIGLIVTSIDDEGFLRVANCGGVDRRLLIGQQVVVHSKKQIIGIISSTPPHLKKPNQKDKTPEVDEILIDIGYNKQQAQAIVSLGDRITIFSKTNMLLNNRISTKALDDRVGVASILYALSLIDLTKIDCNLIVLFSAQEETGERGAKVSAFTHKPDIAICVDVSFAYTSDAIEQKCGKMDEGVMIGISPVLNKNISDFLISAAQNSNIPYQLEIMAGDTSTNADVISITKDGVKCGLLSIPIKYMHSPIETVCIDDVVSTSKLIAEFISKAGEFDV